jgi:tetratricopeptide (TPR) repeat protein
MFHTYFILHIIPEQLKEYRNRVKMDNSDVQAWYWIGYCYFRGTGGVGVDEILARRIWRKALKNFKNGENVQDGTGKIRYALGLQHDQAVPRLQSEAGQGDYVSQFYLACCFMNGWGGLERNNDESAYWFKRAAEQGHVCAQIFTGNYYRLGKGFEKDLVQAVEWYDKAIAQGNDIARRNRQCLIERMDEAERVRVLGYVQCNIWVENVQHSLELRPPLGVWALALEKMAGTQNKWASMSPTFFCMKAAAIAPLLQQTEAKENQCSNFGSRIK